MSEGEHCRVHIRVRAETGFGQTVCIGGNSNALGGFHLSKVIELVTTPESYPIWYSPKPIVLPRNREVLYKYGIMEGGFCKSFEPGNPRSVEPIKWDTVIEDVIAHLHPAHSGHDSDANLMNEMQKLHDDAGVGESAEQNFRAVNGARVFLVCYHLPVKVTRVESGGFKVAWSESLIAKSKEDSISKDTPTYWVGTVTVPGGNSSMTEQEKAYLTEILADMNCIPLFLDEKLARLHYHVYCKQVMWPVYHNVDQLDHIHAEWKTREYRSKVKNGDEAGLIWREQSRDSYAAYVEVNSLFAGRLRELVRPNDIIWVHDYHLTLLPGLVRKFTFPAKTDTETETETEGGTTPAAALKEASDGSSNGLSIVFFLHIPFPTSQIFRSLPNAVELLRSMICADVVGFHAFDYTRHFINACKRMLGIRSKHRPGGLLSLTAGDHDVIVTMSVVSIEVALVQAAVDSNEAKLIAANLRAKYSGKKIIVGVDVCNRLSGISLKFSAFERLLHDLSGASGPGGRSRRRSEVEDVLNSSAHSQASTGSLRGVETSSANNLVLLQRAVRNGARPLDEEHTSRELRTKAAAMNDTFGMEVVDYEETTGLTLAERAGLWLASDIFFLTPIREGLNLMPHEFIYCRKEMPNAGVVIASEFSACCTLLNGALKVNPFDQNVVADTLDKAIQMDNTERDRRRHRDLKFVSTKTSSRWTRQILNEVQGLVRSKELSHVAKLNSTTSADMLQKLVSNSNSSSSRNIGSMSDAKNPPSGVNTTSLMPLVAPNSTILEAYANASLQTTSLPEHARRVLIFDYGGTLLAKECYDIYIKKSLSAISGRKPRDMVMASLKKIAADPLNEVLVVTGLTRLKMGNTFDDYPNISFATSNGLVYYWGRGLLREHEKEVLAGMNANRSEAKWQTMGYDIDWTEVKKIAVPIMTRFVFRTNGTCLTPRIPGIGWSYFGSDPDWGEKQSSQLRVELEASLAKFDVKIVSQIQGSIEIVPKALTKGVFVKHFFKRVLERRAGVLPALTLVVGDDSSDDVMFEALYDIVAEAGPGARPTPMRNFTCVVGKRVSPADFYLSDVKDVEALVQQIANDPSTRPPMDSMDHIVTQVAAAEL